MNTVAPLDIVASTLADARYLTYPHALQFSKDLLGAGIGCWVGLGSQFMCIGGDQVQ